MTLFWIFAIALIALALALVLPPVLRRASPSEPHLHDLVDARRANLAILRDQLKELDTELASGRINIDQHAQARTEIERRVLDEEGLVDTVSAAANPPIAANSKRSAVLVAVCIPLFALGMYGFVGNPQAVLPQAQAPEPEAEVTMAQVEAMVMQMAQKLESQPADQPANPQAWEMLARSYAALQRFPEAARTYEKAAKLAPNNAQLLADYADVLAMLQGQSTAGEPEKLIARALALDPKNLKALALAGSAAFERKDFAAATRFWTQARQLAPATGEFTSGLDRSLEAARDGASAQSSTASNTPKSTPAASLSLSGTVSLAPVLASRVRPGDTVFIFARAADGPRMPLAILKRKAGELPITFTLDDSTAMSDDLKLSKFSNIVVAARVSASGNAMPQSGDLLGQFGPISAGTQNIKIVIESVQP